MKFRSVCKREGIHSWVEIQRKDNWHSRWQYFTKVDSLERADAMIKSWATGAVITAIYDYDKSGERINDFCW